MARRVKPAAGAAVPCGGRPIPDSAQPRPCVPARRDAPCGGRRQSAGACSARRETGLSGERERARIGYGGKGEAGRRHERPDGVKPRPCRKGFAADRAVPCGGRPIPDSARPPSLRSRHTGCATARTFARTRMQGAAQAVGGDGRRRMYGPGATGGEAGAPAAGGRGTVAAESVWRVRPPERNRMVVRLERADVRCGPPPPEAPAWTAGRPAGGTRSGTTAAKNGGMAGRRHERPPRKAQGRRTANSPLRQQEERP